MVVIDAVVRLIPGVLGDDNLSRKSHLLMGFGYPIILTRRFGGKKCPIAFKRQPWLIRRWRLKPAHHHAAEAGFIESANTEEENHPQELAAETVGKG